MNIYKNQTDHSDASNNNLFSDYYWQVKSGYYHEPTSKTIILLDAGWNGNLQELTIEVNGDYSEDLDNGVMQHSDFVNSCCPIIGGGFPDKT